MTIKTTGWNLLGDFLWWSEERGSNQDNGDKGLLLCPLGPFDRLRRLCCPLEGRLKCLRHDDVDDIDGTGWWCTIHTHVLLDEEVEVIKKKKEYKISPLPLSTPYSSLVEAAATYPIAAAAAATNTPLIHNALPSVSELCVGR